MATDGTYVVAIEGLKDLGNLDDLPDEILRAASMAVNSTVRFGRTQASRAIRRQIAFPADYLSDTNGKLRISKFASPEDLSAVISAQRRPTSLARFAKPPLITYGKGESRGNNPGVRVEIKPGHAVRLKNAFLIKLRRGSSTTDTQNNLGLAMRLKPGTKPSKTSKAKEIFPNVWLLYGPSVDQAFINSQSKGVADDISPEIADYLESEFLRLVDLKL